MANIFNNSIEGVRLLIDVIKIAKKEIKELVEISKKVTKEMKFKTSKDFKNLDKEIKEVTQATKELLAIEKQDVQLKQKLSSLRKGEQDAIIKTRLAIQQETKAIKDNVKSIQSLTPQYDKARKKLAAMQKQLIELTLTEKKASKSTIKLRNDVQKLNQQISGAEQMGGRFQRQVGKYPKMLSGAALAFGGAALSAGAFVRVLGSAIGIAKDFEQSNANLASVLGVSRKEIKALTDDAKRLGAATAFSATEISGLQTEFAKLGFNESEILSATEATLNLAAATGSDLGEAAAIAGATLGGFGLNADETGRVVDVMAKSFSTSALDLEKFKESMKSAAPAAKAVGVSVEETTALLGTMANAGIFGSKAGNALKNTFINLNKAGLTLEGGFEKVNKSSDKLGTAVALVGKEAATAFLIMAEGVDDTKRLADGLRDAGGAAEKMALTQLDTLEGSLKILNSAWEGFILGLLDGEGAFSDVSRFIVKLGTNLLSLLSPMQDVKKTQSKLNDENIETIRLSKESASETKNLADRYDELTEKVELNADEKDELNRITTNLIAKFGESVAVINEETGALTINIQAVRKKILADKILSSESTKNLLAEKARLETQIELANQSDKTLSTLREQFKGQFRFTKLIDAAKMGTLEYSKALQEIRLDFQKTGTSSKEFDNKLTAVEGILRRNAAAVFDLGRNTTELNKINEAFLDLGIDIDEVLSSETESIIKGTDAKSKSSKRTRELTGLIEKQAAAVKKLQEAKDRTKDEKEIASLNIKIEAAQIKLKRLKDLGKEEEEERLLKREKITLEIETDPFELSKQGKQLADAREQLNKFNEEQDKKADAAEIKRKKEQAERLRAIFNELALFQKDKFNENQKRLDAEIKGSEDQLNRLQVLADRGSETAKDNLVSEQKRLRELRLQQQKDQEKQKQTELLFKGLDVFSANLAQGQTGTQAAANTITTIKLLGQALRGIPFFAKDGLEDTGTVANPLDKDGGRLGILHDNERVVSKIDNLKMKGISNYELGNLAESYKRGELVQAEQNKINVLSGNYLNNSQMLSKLSDIETALKELPKEMPKSELNVDLIKQVLTLSESQGGKVTNHHIRINKRRSWG